MGKTMPNLVLLLATFVACGCVIAAREQRVPPQPTVFLKSVELVFSCAVAAADSMSWEIVRADRETGVIEARADQGGEDEFELTITVTKRRDGMTEIKLSPEVPEMAPMVERVQPRFASYVRRAIHRR